MRKLLPCPLIYVKEIENWLNKMANEGKHLVKLNQFFAVFKEGECEDIQYAVVMHKEVSTADNASDANKTLLGAIKEQKISERMDKYADIGWELVATNIYSFGGGFLLNARIYSVYKSNETNYNNIKDHFSNQYLINRSKSLEKWFSIFASMILYIALDTYLFALYFSVNTFSPDDYFYRSLRVLALCIPGLVFAYWAIKFIRLHNVYKEKKDTYRPPFKFARLLSTIIILASIPAIILIRPVEYRVTWDSIYFGDIEPLINIEVIEGENSDILHDEMLDDYYEGYFNSTLFMPLHYELSEEAVLFDKYDISYNVEYTKSWFKQPIKRFTHSGLDYYRYVADDKTAYLGSSYFNEISYIYSSSKDKSKPPTIVLLLVGDYEYYTIWYQGNRTPEEIAENIESYLIANE